MVLNFAVLMWERSRLMGSPGAGDSFSTRAARIQSLCRARFCSILFNDCHELFRGERTLLYQLFTRGEIDSQCSRDLGRFTECTLKSRRKLTGVPNSFTLVNATHCVLDGKVV